MNSLVVLLQMIMQALGFGPGRCRMMVRKDGRTVGRPEPMGLSRVLLPFWQTRRPRTFNEAPSGSRFQRESAKPSGNASEKEHRVEYRNGGADVPHDESLNRDDGKSKSGDLLGYLPNNFGLFALHSLQPGERNRHTVGGAARDGKLTSYLTIPCFATQSTGPSPN
jgi:hypothetical protein